MRGEEGSGSVGTPVEVLLGPSQPAQPVGHLVVAMYGGQAELWEAVRSSFSGGVGVGGKLPRLPCFVLGEVGRGTGEWLWSRWRQEFAAAAAAQP